MSKPRSSRSVSTPTNGPAAVGKAAILIAALSPLSGFSPVASAGPVTDTYTGPASGNYNNPAYWSLGLVPNNGNGGNSYDAVVGAGASQNSTVTLDIAPTIDDLTVNTGSAVTVANNLSLTLVGNGTTGGISGGGTLNVASVNNYTDLLVGVPTLTISNTTIDLSADTRVRNDISGTATLVNASGVIQGDTTGGSLGNNDINITNAGIIDANNGTAGTYLYVDPSAVAGLTNTGLMEATNGGLLYLTGNGGGGFANTGGAITAAAGSQVQLTAGASVTGGTLSTTGTGAIVVPAGNTAYLTTLTNSGMFDVANNAAVGIAGTITNNGTINVQSTNNYTDILIDGNTTIAGTGTINLTNNSRVRNNAAGTSVLTIGPGQTIQGDTTGGSLGNNDIDIVNNGTIDANNPATGTSFLIDPSADAGLVNNGLIEATAGGTLILTGNGGGGFTNAGATITAGNGSVVYLVTSVSITGGTLGTAGTGTFQSVTGNAAYLTNLALAGTLDVQNNAALGIAGTITNNGTINVQSINNYTDILIDGNTTIAGTGTINLTNYSRVRNNAAGTSVLTIGPGQTIQGDTTGGSLGNNDIDIVNNGTINANNPATGTSFLIDPSADAGLVNNGLIEATAGGTLILTGNGGGAFTNTGKTIAAGTGSQVQLVTSVSITGGTLSATGTGNFLIPSGNSASLTTLAIAGMLNVGDNAALFVAGTITNNGTISLQSVNDYTDLLIQGNTTINGTGTINLTADDRFRNGYSSASVLTIGSGQIVQGNTSPYGTLGNNDIDVVNNGVVNANTNGLPLFIDPANDNTAFTNNNLIEATAGGILQLTGNGGGAFNNTAGTITAGAGSTVQLIGGVSVFGGSLNGPGTFVIPGSNTASLTTLTFGGTLNITNNAALAVAGTITNNGTVNSQATSSYTDILVMGNTTFAGTGTVNLTGYARIRNDAGTTSTFTVGTGQTVQGDTNAGTFGNNDIAILNQGTIAASNSGLTMFIDPAAVTNAFVNGTTGIVRAVNGGYLELSGNGGGSFTNNGTFDVRTGSTFNVDAGYLTNLNGSTLTGGTYLVTSTGATALLRIGGTPGQVATNAAVVALSGINASFPEITGLAVNQGTFNISNGANFTTPAALSNTGHLAVGAGTTLTVTGSLTQSTTGLLSGAGTVVDSGDALSGTISPGDSGPGDLTLAGTTAITPTAILDFELGPITGPDDLLTLTNGGQATIDGTLDVTPLAGFGPGTYEIVNDIGPIAPSVSLAIGTLPPGYTGQIVTVSGTNDYQVDLKLIAVPEPASAGILLLTLGGLHRRRRV